jgi:SnoaL-like polyketide cyclase
MTAEKNTLVMERFTSEFLTTGDAALAEEFLSPDIVLHFAGQQQRGRDRYLAVVAANADTFEDLCGQWRRWWPTATPWRCGTP